MDLNKLIIQKLISLSKDMDRQLMPEKANYLVKRVVELLSVDISSGKLDESSIEAKINKTFNSITNGEIDCREITVVSIMKALHDKSFGIYPPTTPR